MKKIFLTFVGIILVLITSHFLTLSYGGLPGIWHRTQGRIVTYYATMIHDPGACALIRGYWGRSIHEKLRDRCVENYIKNVVQKKSDCQITELIPDMNILSHIWLQDEYRYSCLIRHYQAMLGNSLTQQWLPQTCLDMRDQLVVMSHYLADIRVARINKDVPSSTSPLDENNISVIEQCEGFLDTPQIYSFLRDTSTPETEQAYITSQKKKVFELQ